MAAALIGSACRYRLWHLPVYRFQFVTIASGVSRNITYNSFRKLSTKAPWEVETNVVKDVVLYSYENARFHKILNLFAITQFVFWIYLAEFSMSTLKDAPTDKQETSENDQDKPWYRKVNLGENKFRTGITTMCIAVGSLLLGVSWMYSLKAVKNVVLRKGGRDVTFITHAPFNKIRYLNAPLKNVSATRSRTTGGATQLPVKVKGYMGYFLVDMKGEFKNAPLYDATMGIKRILK